MSAWGPNGDEEVDVRLYAAVRAGLLTVGMEGTEAFYDVTPLGEARARAAAPEWGADPDALTEQQKVALAADLVTVELR